MYSIQNVIYGIPITWQVVEWLDDRDPEEFGFITFYSGASDIPPGYCGISLGQLDEAADYVKIDLVNNSMHYEGRGSHDIPLEPTDIQIQEAENKIDKLPEELRAIILPVGTYIVFSTS